ncbi:probable sodium/metabolite cotransporter BASS3, chloroplastic isoform X2 [Zingiber officinale]|uniref:probable sodium/metabolite cotransporter BASS3, chloroplastic isoform X2 n=1 Tax=Zingiber officinale TaxID=94328 RepID=UPI001C4BA6E0|nr:probable sodium/metabolite cotransporter BASS3, chloroplastic isoform X2 [Zingiber officinale]
MAALPPSACRGGIGAGRCSRYHVQVKVLPLPSLVLTALSTTPSLKLRAARRRTRWGWTACSTSFPRLGRVGWHRREGSASLLSFGAAPGELLAGGGGNQASDDLSQALSALLPFVVAATAVSALVNPATFSWVSKEYYAPALGGIMLSIGIRLSIDDFALAFKRPLALSVGYIAQYALKPLLGLLIAKAFRTPTMFYAGFILTCCVAGAQLSSYASFLSKSDVALSILLTSSTTISSVLVTPLLTGLLIGSVIPVDGIAMSKSILQARGVSLQNNFTVHRNAELHTRRASCDTISRRQPCSSRSLLSRGDGDNGFKPCILLGHWIQNQRHPFTGSARLLRDSWDGNHGPSPKPAILLASRLGREAWQKHRRYHHQRASKFPRSSCIYKAEAVA